MPTNGKGLDEDHDVGGEVAAKGDDEIIHQLAAVLCSECKRQLNGKRPLDRDYNAVTKFGQAIVGGRFKSIAGLQTQDTIIMMRY